LFTLLNVFLCQVAVNCDLLGEWGAVLQVNSTMSLPYSVTAAGSYATNFILFLTEDDYWAEFSLRFLEIKLFSFILYSFDNFSLKIDV